MTTLCQCHFCHLIQTTFISNHNYHDFCWLSLKHNGAWNNVEVRTNVPLYTPMSQLALVKWISLQKSYHRWHVMISTQTTSPSCHENFSVPRMEQWLLPVMVLPDLKLSDACQKIIFPQWCFFPRQKVNHHWGIYWKQLLKKNKQILISSKQSNQYLSNIGGKKVLPSKRRNHCNLDAKFYHQIYSINPENQPLDLSCHWWGLERFNSEPCGKNRVKQNPSFVGGS